MKILALDTSRKTSDATFLDTDTGREITESCGEKNNESLLLMIERVLQKAEASLEDMDCLAVSIGPGSFTGLRIGITTMKSFAQIRDIPLYGMNTLTALQMAVHTDDQPLLDARGGRVYAMGIGQDETVLVQAEELPLEGRYVSFSSPLLKEAMGDRTVHWVPEDLALSPVIARHGFVRKKAGINGDWRRLLPDYVGVSQAEREKKSCRA